MDEIFQKLRKLGVGSHLGKLFCGAVGYCDDLLLLAPSRSAMMELMLKACEEYALENNLEFSTDPDPKKSKSMCIYMHGSLKKGQLPLNLSLA